MKKYYLIKFTYNYIFEEGVSIPSETETMLVCASSYMKACEKLIEKYSNARDFKNLTVS